MRLPNRHYIAAAIAIASSLATLITAPASYAFNLGMHDGANAAKGMEQVSDLFGATGIFNTITNILLFAIGAISVIMIIIGGLRYVVSGGDSSNITAAKNTILYAVVGLVVALLAYAIINFVLTSFSADGMGGNGGTDV
ncbi:MAG TPA: pilin [Candidatus Saccharimonadales bacterium]|nr:pilin [Candidatus Saccharimonadales bacterium]